MVRSCNNGPLGVVNPQWCGLISLYLDYFCGNSHFGCPLNYDPETYSIGSHGLSHA